MKFLVMSLLIIDLRPNISFSTLPRKYPKVVNLRKAVATESDKVPRVGGEMPKGKRPDWFRVRPIGVTTYYTLKVNRFFVLIIFYFGITIQLYF